MGRNGGPTPRSGQDAHESADHQTLDDRDQTLSDRDQTLSDRDQQASDDDQMASDREHGADPDVHARTAAVRAGTSRERLEDGQQRDETAVQRDQAAKDRDELAAQRDREAEGADRRALELDVAAGQPDNQTLRGEDHCSRALEIRERAARERERAARDRREAAGDRERAEHDREQATHERERAGTDELTGARRRGVGLEELEREIIRARRTGQSLVVAYVDVDGLKAVNDERGHSAGDELLREVAKALRQHMRTYDLLVRLGGDEFLCVLPGVSVEEVRRRLNELSTDLPAGPIAGSVSMGLSELRGGDSAKQLIERADHDLLAVRSG